MYHIRNCVGVPERVSNIMIDIQHIEIDGRSVNFTLSWTEPFANFDPISIYTITINCTSNATECPVMFNTETSIRSIYIVMFTDLSKRNLISVTASNSVGESEPGRRIFVG